MSTADVVMTERSFCVAPNPTAGAFSITLPNHCSYVEIDITDVFGRTIYKKATSGQRFQIDLKDNTTGIYFVHVHTNDGSEIRKLIMAQ